MCGRPGQMELIGIALRNLWSSHFEETRAMVHFAPRKANPGASIG